MATAYQKSQECCAGQETCGKCIRGLLCSLCNVLIGQAREDKIILKNMIEYLTKWGK